MNNILIFIIGLLLGTGLIYIVDRFLTKKGYINGKEVSKTMVENAKNEAEKIKIKARSEADKKSDNIIFEAKKDAKDIKAEAKGILKRINYKEDILDKKEINLHGRETDLRKKESEIRSAMDSLEARKKNISQKEQTVVKELERVAGMSSEEAKQDLSNRMEEDARRESVEKLRKIEDETNDTAKDKAARILAVTCDRMAHTYISERVSSTVNLPSDDMKGRIIGREGRNIRSFESVTGVDVIVDDTPEVVVLSSFNTYRRKIAQVALERLIVDGRIHPVKIESVVKKVKAELDDEAMDYTKKLLLELNLSGININIVKLLAKLKFRTSYTQNVLAHSVEVAYITGMIASELGLRSKLAKKMGLLHDIGKALDQEAEGNHPELGADIARRYNEPSEVINAILSHHGAIEPSCAESVLVSVADTLSAARPGARSELLANYIKRITELEAVAKSFSNVNECYALQAGREVRVIINPKSTNDNDAYLLAKDIAKEIKKKVTYPGEVKITIIREVRASEIAA